MIRVETVLGLVHLVATADGNVKAKELELVNKLLLVEKLSDKDASVLLEKFQGQSRQMIFDSCIQELKKADKPTQIKYVAWLCVIANADGFMDQQEWALIYQIYHKELGLHMNDVMSKQREINRDILNRVTSFGIKVND